MIRKTIFGAWFIACLVLLSGVVVGQFPDPELLRANELRNRGDYDGAIAIYTKALETAETKAKASLYIARANVFLRERVRSSYPGLRRANENASIWTA